MGFSTVVLDPDPTAPAGSAADVHLCAGFDDEQALTELAGMCDVVTTEFENPPASSLEFLADRVRVAPSARAIAVAQDRIAEKRFLESIGVPVGPWRPIESSVDLADVHDGYPAILKTARFGYDGKGQQRVADERELADSWAQLGSVPCVLEQLVPFDVEVSIVVARGADGGFAAYAVSENLHVDGILDLTVAPARVPTEIADRVTGLAMTVADQLAYVGVLAVECFVVGDDVLVNELAPRPHNSGHWTLDAAVVDQFAQQVRAVCGLPLGSTAMTRPAVAMVNVLGETWADGPPDWVAAWSDPDVAVHLYGKAEPRPGRKMGHLTAWGPTVAVAEVRARNAHRAVMRG
jgi:5-(carboxyamino)imidazole ribonucleotide synthase